MQLSTLEHPVEAILAIPFLIMGFSHLVRPNMWQEFFVSLHSMGERGVIWRSCILELWPAAIIVTFHQQWAWPGIIITLYGHALMAKVALCLLVPKYGLKSLAMAGRYGKKGFRVAGVVLCLLGIFCVCRIVF
ncbi:MAG: hypothetical protein AAGA18_01235 [Verrucomicrobiota bacterium]